MSILQLNLGNVNVTISEMPCPDTAIVRLPKQLNNYQTSKQLGYRTGYNHHYKNAEFFVGVKDNPVFSFDGFHFEWKQKGEVRWTEYEDIKFSFHKIMKGGKNYSGYKSLQSYNDDRAFSLNLITQFIRSQAGIGKVYNKFGDIMKHCPVAASPLIRYDTALNMRTKSLNESFGVLDYLATKKLRQKRNPPFRCERGIYWFTKKAVRGVETDVVNMKDIEKFAHQSTRVVTAYIPEGADTTVRVETRSIGLQPVNQTIERASKFQPIENNLISLTDIHTTNIMFWQDVLSLFNKAQQHDISERFLLDVLPSFKDSTFKNF